MSDKIKKFVEERDRLNKLALERDNLNIKRFFTLDRKNYEDGALDSKTKEMLGLVASMVLRCEDCIQYHLMQCHKFGVTDAELNEVVSTAIIVGGSIVIPHARRAFGFWEELKEMTDEV